MAFVRPAKQPGSLGDLLGERRRGEELRELLRNASRIAAGIGPRELRVRGGATGIVQGRHRSRGAGASTEFYEFRPYSVGDDAGRIDWKVYARSDRLYLRRFAAETRQTVGLAINCSPSMLFRGLGPAAKDKPSKLEVALAMATAFGLITLRSGDRVAGIVSDPQRQNARVEIPALSGLGSLAELGGRMVEGAQIPETRTARRRQALSADGLRDTLRSAAQLSSTRGVGGSAMVILFSDALGEPGEVLGALEAARSSGTSGALREVALIRILTPEEADGPPIGTQRFVDSALRGIGAGKWGRANTKAALEAYRTRMRAHRDTLRHGVLAMGGRYVEHRTIEDPAQALIKLLESG
ncbi:MAG: DUF58 domain-containing protein [Phycisphaerales bacterium]